MKCEAKNSHIYNRDNIPGPLEPQVPAIPFSVLLSSSTSSLNQELNNNLNFINLFIIYKKSNIFIYYYRVLFFG